MNTQDRAQSAQTADPHTRGGLWTVKIGSDNRTRKIAPAAEHLILQRLVAQDIELLSWQKGEGVWQGQPEEVLTLGVQSPEGFAPLFDALYPLLAVLEQEAIGVYREESQYIRLTRETCLIPAGAQSLRTTHTDLECLDPDARDHRKAWQGSGRVRASLHLACGAQLVWIGPGHPARDPPITTVQPVNQYQGANP